MKKIINRQTGNCLTFLEASKLSATLKYEYNIKTLHYKSKVEYGYETAELALNAEAKTINELYKDYIFAYIKPTYYGLEGYKLYFIAFPKLPDNFEKIYPNLVVSE